VTQRRSDTLIRRGDFDQAITFSPHLVTLSLFLVFLAIYVRTAAPSVLSGDSAEFQLAAPLLGVPHPTTYPLYILLGKLATLLVPLGDMAWRVTLVSAASAALAVALFYVLARRVTGSTGAAALAALALGVAPGLWNAATLAEVYALLATLLAGLGCLFVAEGRPPTADRRPPTIDRRPPTANRQPPTTNRRPPTADRQPATDNGLPTTGRRPEDKPASRRAEKPTTGNSLPAAHLLAHPLTPSPSHTLTPSAPWRLRTAAFVAGLGCTHHGLFVLTGLPLFAAYALWLLLRRSTDDSSRLPSPVACVKHLAVLGLCFAAGLTPWLYPLVQYARYGPFDGVDYGLPRHYFWGAPQSWGALADLLSGGTVRRGIFRLPSAGAALATLRLVAERMWFEFGPLGVALGVLGCLALLRRSRPAWLGAAWVFLATLAYLLLLGPAVEDAPIFTLPMLLPWALWIAAAAEFILSMLRRPIPGGAGAKNHEPETKPAHPVTLSPCHPVKVEWPSVILALLLAATLAWGYTRIQHSSKRRLWLFREFGQATLAALPPDAVVIAHWEQGMTLHYLRLVEGQRPDVWVDVVEPSDEAWGARAARRYAGRPVFFVGRPADVAGLPVDLLRAAEYADLFRLRDGGRN
jgi:transmembrane protein TMEM260 (protein O-mannosyltransferase)